MADAFLLTIDLDLLSEHFMATNNKLWTAEECKEWLLETGFRQTDDGRWLAEEVLLDALDKSKIKKIESLTGTESQFEDTIEFIEGSMFEGDL